MQTVSAIKYFKFLNFWTDHPVYVQTVQNIWNEQVYGNPLYIFHQNLKRQTCKHLSIWSWQTFGDGIEEPKRMKAQLRNLKEDCVNNNTPESRCELWRCNAEFIGYLNIKDAILWQKTRIKRLENGVPT